jgi:hypothetical protein
MTTEPPFVLRTACIAAGLGDAHAAARAVLEQQVVAVFRFAEQRFGADEAFEIAKAAAEGISWSVYLTELLRQWQPTGRPQ